MSCLRLRNPRGSSRVERIASQALRHRCVNDSDDSTANENGSRIVFFPSWNPDSASFVSRSAAERWNHHRSVVGEFEEELVHSGWMQRAFGRGHWRDGFAREWREGAFT